MNDPLVAYEAGQYVLALELVRAQMNAPHNDYTYAWIAADICTRNLDDGNHTLDEAVELHCAAAFSGDTDIISWIMTKMPYDMDWYNVTPPAARQAVLALLEPYYAEQQQSRWSPVRVVWIAACVCVNIHSRPRTVA